jgi:hypothetical protein
MTTPCPTGTESFAGLYVGTTGPGFASAWTPNGLELDATAKTMIRVVVHQPDRADLVWTGHAHHLTLTVDQFPGTRFDVCKANGADVTDQATTTTSVAATTTTTTTTSPPATVPASLPCIPSTCSPITTTTTVHRTTTTLATSSQTLPATGRNLAEGPIAGAALTALILGASLLIAARRRGSSWT